MARVLFGWELGANLGHAALIADLARGLASDGVEITVAGVDLAYTRAALLGIDARILQAPRWPYHRHVGSETGQAGYLDLLALIGFADPAKLSAVAEAWGSLIDLTQPDLIVADHGPGLLVATYGRGIPVVAIGTGFTMPPLDAGRLPPLRADRGQIMPESRLLAAANQPLAKRGVASPATLVDLFRTDERFVFGLPELDPYRAFRREPLYAPPGGFAQFIEPPVTPHLFVYLGEEMPHLDALAKVLADGDISVTAYFRGDVGLMADFLARRGHTIHKSPPRLTDLLPAVSHVLSAGGLFTSVAALAAGRPQLIMPLHDEARLNFRMLEQLGVARQMTPSGEPSVLSGQLRAFLLDHGMAREARHWAKVVGLRPIENADAALSALRRRLK